MALISTLGLCIQTHGSWHSRQHPALICPKEKARGKENQLGGRRKRGFKREKEKLENIAVRETGKEKESLSPVLRDTGDGPISIFKISPLRHCPQQCWLTNVPDPRAFCFYWGRGPTAQITEWLLYFILPFILSLLFFPTFLFSLFIFLTFFVGPTALFDLVPV